MSKFVVGQVEGNIMEPMTLAAEPVVKVGTAGVGVTAVMLFVIGLLLLWWAQRTQDLPLGQKMTGYAPLTGLGVWVVAAILAPGTYLPEYLADTSYRVSVDDTVSAIEETYGVTVLAHPKAHSALPVLSEDYLVQTEDGQTVRCALWSLGPPTAGTVETSLRCEE